MQIVLNISGTHVHNKQLKVLISFYPEANDKSYLEHHVNGNTYPCLNAFVSVDDSLTPEQLTKFITNTYTPDVLTTIDDIMSRKDENDPHLSTHTIAPFM